MIEERDEKADNTLTISVLVPHNSEPIKIKIKKNTPMQRVFKAISQNLGVDEKMLRFLFDGVRINEGWFQKIFCISICKFT